MLFGRSLSAAGAARGTRAHPEGASCSRASARSASHALCSKITRFAGAYASYYRKEIVAGVEGARDAIVDGLRVQRPEAIELLLATFGREIQAVAYFIVGSRADAEEILIDTTMTAWRHGKDLRNPTALRPWLLRIATRLALSRRRKIGTAMLELPEDLPLRASDPSDIDRLAMHAELAKLPAQVRAAIVLHYFADLTIAGTAEVLGKSPNTVKVQVRDGLRRLRVGIDEREHPSDA
jgi:RNA polymerase sigma-70 factor (ECF subfamily)